METVGKAVNAASLGRSLDHMVRQESIRGWHRYPNGKWSVQTTDGRDYALTGLAQVHALVVGLVSASQQHMHPASASR